MWPNSNMTSSTRIPSKLILYRFRTCYVDFCLLWSYQYGGRRTASPHGTITLGIDRRNVSGIGTDSPSDGILTQLLMFELPHISPPLRASRLILMWSLWSKCLSTLLQKKKKKWREKSDSGCIPELLRLKFAQCDRTNNETRITFTEEPDNKYG